MRNEKEDGESYEVLGLKCTSILIDASQSNDPQKENQAVPVRKRRRKIENKPTLQKVRRPQRKSLKTVQAGKKSSGDHKVKVEVDPLTLPGEKPRVKRSLRIREQGVVQAASAKVYAEKEVLEPVVKKGRRGRPKAAEKANSVESHVEPGETAFSRDGRRGRPKAPEKIQADVEPTKENGHVMEISPALAKRRRRRNNEASEPGAFQCDFCGMGCSSKTSKTLHMKTKHLEKYNQSLICDCCQHSFPNTSSLEAHRGNPYGGQCSLCGAQASNLKTHMATRHQEQKPCEICGAQFGMNPSARRTHRFKVHGIGKDKSRTRYSCPDCSQVFIQRPDQVRHRVKKHGFVPADKDTFRCPHCAKEYYIKQDFKEHVNGHLGIKPHKCPFCAYATNMDTSLRIHLRQVHKTTKSLWQAIKMKAEVDPLLTVA